MHVTEMKPITTARRAGKARRILDDNLCVLFWSRVIDFFLLLDTREAGTRVGFAKLSSSGTSRGKESMSGDRSGGFPSMTGAIIAR